MCSEHHPNKYQLSDQEKWRLDQVIMHSWEAKTEMEKKSAELECYKFFKINGFKHNYVDYLNDHGCEDLAIEMEHFAEMHDRVPHLHEKQAA